MAPTEIGRLPSRRADEFGRVAVVHEWLTTYAGSERVLEQILKIWSEADLFCVVDFFPDAQRSILQGKRATTSFIQRLPRARKSFRAYLPLMPLAVEQFDLSGYDLVISSSHAVAKGVITGPGQLHVSYPTRHTWRAASTRSTAAPPPWSIRRSMSTASAPAAAARTSS